MASNRNTLSEGTRHLLSCYFIRKKLKEKEFSGGASLSELISYLQEEFRMIGVDPYVGTSESSVRRIIEKRLSELGIDIAYNYSHKGWFIINERNPDVVALLEKHYLFELIKISGKMQSFIFAEGNKNKTTKLISQIIEAITYSERVEFRYRKFDNTITKERRIVEPHALKEFKGRWYLLAIEIDGRLEERGLIKTWGLDRIENFHITNTTFTKNKNLNLENEFKNCFGIDSDEKKEVEEIILSFVPTSGKYNEALPLHESQETIVDNEEEFRIRLKVKITYDFIMELLSQSEGMKVIAPKHLRDTLIDIHKKAIKSLEEVV